MSPWPFIAVVGLLRLLAAFLFVYVLLPLLIFPRRPVPGSSPLVERALWMSFVATVAAHALAVAHIYEAIVFLVMVVLAAYWIRSFGLTRRSLDDIAADLISWFFDLVDGKSRLPPPRQILRRIFSTQSGEALPWWAWIGGVALAAILGVAAWMLYHEAFHNPAPDFSDAPVNLAWLKYMEKNHLYGPPGGEEVYPRGMYAFLTLLRKFTVLPTVVVLDFTGPLIGLLILASLLFFTYKTTRSFGAVIIVALLYGTLPALLPYDFPRHAAHNSQEYGLVFVLPAAWYAYAYLVRGRPRDRATAAAAAGVTAFTHPVPALFAVVAMSATGLVALLSQGSAWRRLPSLAGWVGAAGAAGVAPMAIALALGQKWHGSSLAYAVAPLANSLPPINRLYLGTVAAGTALVLLILTGVWLRRAGGDNPWASRAAAAAVVAVAIAMDLMPYAGIRLQAVADRIPELAAAGLAVGAGLLWSIPEAVLGRFRWLSVLLAAALVGPAWYYYPPRPAQPYHMYTRGEVNAFLWGREHWVAGQWTLVMTAEVGYALALDVAHPLTPAQFLEFAAGMPEKAADWSVVGNSPNRPPTYTPDYLLVVQKYRGRSVFETPQEIADQAKPVEQLQAWIDARRDSFPLKKLYEDDQTAVWTLEIPKSPQEQGIYAPEKPAQAPAGG